MRTSPRGKPDAEISAEVRELLERRAERMRARPSSVDAEVAVVWIAEAVVGEERYGLRLEVVRAAMPLRMVTHVPLAPPNVIGVLRYEGHILTVYSLASVLGVRGWRVDPAILLVLDAGPGRMIAVDCEQVPRATALSRSVVEEARARASAPVVPILTAAHGHIQLIDDLPRLIEASHPGGGTRGR